MRWPDVKLPERDRGMPTVEVSERKLRERLIAILRATPPLMRVLSGARHLCLPDWLVFSGAIYQPVLNRLTGRPLDDGIKDYDLGYFDASDLSYEAEDAVIRRVNAAFGEPLRKMVEVRNQARVHLWFEAKFGEPYAPLSCVINHDFGPAASHIHGGPSETDRLSIRIGHHTQREQIGKTEGSLGAGHQVPTGRRPRMLPRRSAPMPQPCEKRYHTGWPNFTSSPGPVARSDLTWISARSLGTLPPGSASIERGCLIVGMLTTRPAASRRTHSTSQVPALSNWRPRSAPTPPGSSDPSPDCRGWARVGGPPVPQELDRQPPDLLSTKSSKHEGRFRGAEHSPP